MTYIVSPFAGLGGAYCDGLPLVFYTGERETESLKSVTVDPKFDRSLRREKLTFPAVARGRNCASRGRHRLRPP